MYLFITIAQAIRPTYAFSFVVGPHTELLKAVLAVLGCVISPILLAILIFVFHEWCHGLAFRWAGAKPQYGAKVVKRVLPVFYATAPGKWLTRHQYLVILLTPTVVVNLAGIALMWPPTLLRYLMIFPMAAHFCGCIGDWWMAASLLRLPAGTRFEDTQEGFRYRYENPS